MIRLIRDHRPKIIVTVTMFPLLCRLHTFKRFPFCDVWEVKYAQQFVHLAQFNVHLFGLIIRALWNNHPEIKDKPLLSCFGIFFAQFKSGVCFPICGPSPLNHKYVDKIITQGLVFPAAGPNCPESGGKGSGGSRLELLSEWGWASRYDQVKKMLTLVSDRNTKPYKGVILWPASSWCSRRLKTSVTGQASCYPYWFALLLSSLDWLTNFLYGCVASHQNSSGKIIISNVCPWTSETPNTTS